MPTPTFAPGRETFPLVYTGSGWEVLYGDSSGLKIQGGGAGGAVSITGEVEVKNDTGNPLPVAPQAGELHLGEVGGYSPRVTATFTRPADNTAYAAGDIIANSGTANLVTPLTFAAARVSGGSGRLTGCRAVVTPASGNLIITNLKFDLLIFRAATDIPFAAAGYPADNAQMTITAAALRELVAVFSFLDTGWRSGLGSLTAAGAAGWQSVLLASGRNFAPFNLASIPSQNLVGVVQAQAAWTPTNVANQFDFALDVEGN